MLLFVGQMAIHDQYLYFLGGEVVLFRRLFTVAQLIHFIYSILSFFRGILFAVLRYKLIVEFVF